jgi:hypothetical protein
MNVFKGLLFLEDSTTYPVPLSDEFGPQYGNSVATRQWLSSPFDANRGGSSVEGVGDDSRECLAQAC